MLNGEGNEKGKKNNNDSNKTKQNKTIGLKQKKKKFRLQHTFLYIFAVVFDYYNVKLPILVTRFIEEMSHE